MNRTEASSISTPQMGIVEKVTRLLDDQFTIPGTRIRFGLDPILGLIPLVGDVSTFAVSAALILTMMRHGVSRQVALMMVGNLLLDGVVGAIPILGRIFDVAYKANRRNVELLRRHYVEGKYQGSGTGILIVVGLILLIFLIGIGFIVWKISSAILSWNWSF